uniref:Uncharacterized protein n=1 Tax=Setaria italica TaxID=4555 RepID=K3ZGI0_SETIT
MDRLVGPCLSTTTILCGCCSAGDPRRCDAILCEAWPCGTTCPCKAAKPLHLLAGHARSGSGRHRDQGASVARRGLIV